jgi:hypothetical protein
MDERERLPRKIIGQNEDDFVELSEEPINTEPLFLLREIWPDVVERLKALLIADGELDLAATVEDLQVYDRCRCGADYCAMVDTKPRMRGGFGPTHPTLSFWNSDKISPAIRVRYRDACTSPTTKYLTILEVVDEEIVLIEILDDHESRRRLVAALPDPGATELSVTSGGCG